MESEGRRPLGQRRPGCPRGGSRGAGRCSSGLMGCQMPASTPGASSPGVRDGVARLRQPPWLALRGGDLVSELRAAVSQPAPAFLPDSSVRACGLPPLLLPSLSIRSHAGTPNIPGTEKSPELEQNFKSCLLSFLAAPGGPRWDSALLFSGAPAPPRGQNVSLARFLSFSARGRTWTALPGCRSR